MKQITEEKRQALIKDCEKDIKSLIECISECRQLCLNNELTYYESQLLRQEIALASLTAKAAKYTNAGYLELGRDGGTIVSRKSLSYNTPLYTTPPVPVIKPDQLEGVQVSVDVSTCDSDAGNRIFGRVTSMTESKGETVLLVEETSRNFN